MAPSAYVKRMELHQHMAGERGVLHKPWEHTALKVLSYGGLTTAALALSPVVFPLFSKNLKGIGEAAIAFCTTGAPSGLAGSVSSFLTPILGTTLAAGGWATVGLSGALAIGGMWLGNYIDKRTEKGNFRWGAVVRWGCLATSMLIALPAILPAISMGLMFLGTWAGSNGLMGAAVDIGRLGAGSAMAKAAASGAVSTAVGTASLAAMHALTCALPLGSAGFFLGQKEEKQPRPQSSLVLPAFRDGRVSAQLASVQL